MGNNAARGAVSGPSEDKGTGRNETSPAPCGSIGVSKASASDPDGRYASPLRKRQPCAAVKVEDIPEPSSVGWRISVIAFVFQDVGCTLYAGSSKDEKPASGGFSVAYSANRIGREDLVGLLLGCVDPW
jgi:hypothetical protein